MAQIDPNEMVQSLQTTDGQDLLVELKVPLVNIPTEQNFRSDQVPWCPFIPTTNGKDCPILITDVQSLSRIHVQYLESDSLAADSKSKLQDALDLATSPPQFELNVGDLVAAPFSDNWLYRAEILSLKNVNVSVYFIDYGNSFIGKKDRILALPPYAVEIPPLSFAVSDSDDAYQKKNPNHRSLFWLFLWL